MNDMELFGTLDQVSSLPADERTNMILQKVEDTIRKAIQGHDPDLALNAVSELVIFAKISGIALAKIIYLLVTNRDELGIGDDWKERLFEVTGLHPHTVERYYYVWEMHSQIPATLSEQITHRNIRDQIPVALALSQGYEITGDQWQQIADASDEATIRKILREDVKGKDPRKNAIAIAIDARGTLWAYSDEQRYFVGSLELKDDTAVVQKAIQRILKNASIMENK